MMEIKLFRGTLFSRMIEIQLFGRKYIFAHDRNSTIWQEYIFADDRNSTIWQEYIFADDRNSTIWQEYIFADDRNSTISQEYIFEDDRNSRKSIFRFFVEQIFEDCVKIRVRCSTHDTALKVVAFNCRFHPEGYMMK